VTSGQALASNGRLHDVALAYLQAAATGLGAATAVD
jgi:hypothetical protein